MGKENAAASLNNPSLSSSRYINVNVTRDNIIIIKCNTRQEQEVEVTSASAIAVRDAAIISDKPGRSH